MKGRNVSMRIWNFNWFMPHPMLMWLTFINEYARSFFPFPYSQNMEATCHQTTMYHILASVKLSTPNRFEWISSMMVKNFLCKLKIHTNAKTAINHKNPLRKRQLVNHMRHTKKKKQFCGCLCHMNVFNFRRNLNLPICWCPTMSAWCERAVNHFKINGN